MRNRNSRFNVLCKEQFFNGDFIRLILINNLLNALFNHSKTDGKVFFRITEVHIELYTDEKNPEVEALVETVLDAHGIFYDKTEVWIDSEKLYEVLYSFETED